jgi:dimethylhistidine N-methyltransferase
MTQALRLPPNVSFRDEHPDLGDGRAAILEGLRATPKRVNPMWFYDKRGSELFDDITRQPEYYPTRTEIGILRRHAAAIADHCGRGGVVIEPGSGSSDKVRLLLNDLRPAAYVPVDISAEFLRQAAAALGVDYPWLSVNAVCADFNAGLGVGDDLPAGRRLVFYPGSTLGNLEAAAARAFLRRLAELIGDEGAVLIGVDTHKDSAVLDAAYNDAAGVTAAFNLNLLTRLDSMLEADFGAARFRHHAFYNEDLRRIEMHLVSEEAQEVRIGADTLRFDDGESIHTENSYKYSPGDFAALAGEAGLRVSARWFDERMYFGVYCLRRLT